MKIYKGFCASPGLVLGQVSRLEHHVETTTVGPFKPSRELQLLTDAIRTAQDELESMADRAAPSEQAIFQFQSMMLDDEGMMNEVRFCINAGIGAAAAMNQVGQRYADQLANMKDNPYMQLRSVDILDASRRVINIITNRPRMWLALDHPVILAAERLMPTDLFSVPSGMILGIITAEGSGQSHAAIIARAMNIPGIVQVGRDFLDDCDGRTVILDATGGQCTLDPDAAARQQAETRICELQRENEEMGQLHALPNRTKDGQPFELLANCFGPEDIDTAMQSGAQGVGLLRTGYMMLPGRILDEQEQYFFYCSCLAAAQATSPTARLVPSPSVRWSSTRRCPPLQMQCTTPSAPASMSCPLPRNRSLWPWRKPAECCPKRSSHFWLKRAMSSRWWAAAEKRRCSISCRPTAPARAGGCWPRPRPTSGSRTTTWPIQKPNAAPSGLRGSMPFWAHRTAAAS